jgi:hypothetical protein
MKLVKFQSENLVVDYISFNITGYKDPKPITTYLFDSFGFNSVMKENFKGKSEDLIFKITNKYKVSFVKSTYNPESNSYWTGMTVKFSGENGKYFYSLIRRQLIDWCSFDLSCTNLGRFDLYYFRKSKPNLNSLVNSYLKKGNLEDFVQKEQFFKLIQLLSFLRTLGYSRQFLDNQAYCVLEFAVMDFIGFTGGDMKSTYERTKALKFLTSLQDLKPLIQKFSNEEFRRSVMFPYLKLKKQNRKWTVTLAVVEEFYFYQYPFLFPNSFLICNNKYDLEIKLQLIESFSTVELEKKLLVKRFLNQFSVPNKDLAKIKKQLIDSFFILKDFQLIENKFSLISKNGSSNKLRHRTEKIESLSPGMLFKSESLSFWEKIELKTIRF